MRPPKEVKQDLVQQWLDKAESDYRLIEHLMSENTLFFSAVGFHAQQAVEKYLKAFLTFHQVEFPKTHNLGEIINLVGTVDTSLAESFCNVTILNFFSVEVRYPGDMSEMSQEGAIEALELTENVREVILDILGNIKTRKV